MTIPRIAAGIGLSRSRTRDACDFLTGKQLVAKRGSLRQYFYYITSDGVVYVDSSHPRSARAPAVQPDSLAEGHSRLQIVDCRLADPEAD